MAVTPSSNTSPANKPSEPPGETIKTSTPTSVPPATTGTSVVLSSVASFPNIPHEDQLLEVCGQAGRPPHDWSDLYYGSGIDKYNPSRALVTFFCKRCLEIRVKSYDQSRFKLRDEDDE